MTTLDASTVPHVTATQMREVDRVMVEDVQIRLLQMMEHAGRHLAHLARVRLLDGDVQGQRVVVLCGTGGNGGGGLVAARRLHAWGATVTVVTTRPEAAYAGVPAHQLGILRRLEVPALHGGNPSGITLPEAALLLDALIGYSLDGAPRGAAARLIERANAHAAPVLSLDVPSGLEATSGTVHTPTVRAAATLTLALPKTGLRAAEARSVIGELYLGDIGVPPSVYASPSLDFTVGALFSKDDLLRLDNEPSMPR
jgi:NAD(P)H-hydrate epimerase